MGIRSSSQRASEATADAVVWERAVSGDRAAFGELFDRHASAVYAHCLRRAGSAVDAEDLTSMTFLEVLRHKRRPRFVDGSILPWLMVVGTNVARNHARSQRRYAAALSKLAVDRPLEDFAQEAAERIDGEFMLEAFARAVDQLPKRQQEVLSLCDLSGLSYAETAAALGVPIGTVQSRLSRARRQLRQLLTDLSPAAPSRPLPTTPGGGSR